MSARHSNPTKILSLEDERVAEYRDLREAHLAVRRQAFIAESEVVLRVFIARGRYPMRSVLIAEPKLDKISDALAELDDSVPIYVASQEVLNQVVGFRIHRGILAAGTRTPLPAPEALLSSLLSSLGLRSPVLVLESLTNHDNVGGVFRNAAAFGAAGVLIDTATCDPLYRKAIRVSVGAALFMPYARAQTTADNIAALRAHGYTLVALSPRADAIDIRQLQAPSKTALLLGTEGAGLSPETMDAADLIARIDMAAGFDSLNVATTSGIALHACVTPVTNLCQSAHVTHNARGRYEPGAHGNVNTGSAVAGVQCLEQCAHV